MGKWRRKTTFVQAEQWWPNKQIPGVFKNMAGSSYVMPINKNICYLNPGDWVIQESDGKHSYPCIDAIFTRTYEKVSWLKPITKDFVTFSSGISWAVAMLALFFGPETSIPWFVLFGLLTIAHWLLTRK